MASPTRYRYGTTQQGVPVSATRIEGESLSAVVMDYGLRLVSLEWKTGDGETQSLVQGGWPLRVYENDDAYHGAVVGRTCNRICQGELVLGGRSYQLDKNDGEHHIHGGLSGLHNKVWQAETIGNNLVANTRLADGASGYPGNLDVTVRIAIENNTLCYTYEAVSDRDTAVDFTNHAYFCLDHSETILQHRLQVVGDYMVPVDEELIPIGLLEPVGTRQVFDLRSPQLMADVLANEDPQLKICQGIDHSWLLNQTDGPVALLQSQLSGIELSVFTSSPALQVYSGNHLSTPHSAICLETQHLPDAYHHPAFDTPTLKAGDHYHSWTRYQFNQC